jgi:hypothetical protein
VQLFSENGIPKGWTVVQAGDLSKKVPGVHWRVENGILKSSRQPDNYLMSNKEYGDFILECEIKLTERGDSGIALRAPMRGIPAFAGMELQVVDPRSPSVAQAKESELTGAIWGAIPPTKQVYKPINWNKFRIKLKGSHLEVTLNEKMIQDADLNNYDQLVRPWPNQVAPPIKDRPRKGHIGFQHCGPDPRPVLVRNARIQELKEMGAPPAEPQAGREYVWIEDALPVGAEPWPVPGTVYPWNFIRIGEGPVLSGSRASWRLKAERCKHNSFFHANPGLPVGNGDKLFVYVYIDSANPPKTVMLQFNDGTWGHRAFWGEDRIGWGPPDRETLPFAHLEMGKLPEADRWVRLEVEAARVGLEPGSVINGWAFTQFGGTVYWAKAGIVTLTPGLPSK